MLQRGGHVILHEAKEYYDRPAPPAPCVSKKGATQKCDKVDSKTVATANLGNAACSDKVKS